MAIQTQQLSESLPQFASCFKSADAKGSSMWQIVQWSEIDPTEVTPEQVSRPERLTDNVESVPNCFANRTQALRYSRVHVRQLHPKAKETGHWGVWRWIENGLTRYQTVAPVTKSLTSGALTSRREQGAAHVREQRSEGYSSMVRVSAETNRRLREIVAEDKTTLQLVIDAAVKEYYRTWFFRRADAAYDALQQDEAAWTQEVDERQLWDATLMDGIDRDEVWQQDGSVLEVRAKAGKRD